MDLSESLVDLLLVRLGREEEKQRVLELLVAELHMTREAARNAVDSAPAVLMEAVPMGQARVIQNRLYPFIDLLPRMDSVPDSAEEDRAPAAAPAPAPPSSAEDYDEPIEDGYGEMETSAGTITAKTARDAARASEESLSVTSASEEVLLIERCHVCGRTPTGGERLAPCRSCAELTCRDCFDRVAHVCQKCSAEGKVIDAPLARTASSRSATRHGAEAAEPEPVRSQSGSKSPAPLIAVVLFLALAAGFYLVDPLDLFGGSPGAPADSLHTAPDTLASDSLGTPPDSVPADTTHVVQIYTDDQFMIRHLELPEGVEETGQALSVHTDAPQGVTVLLDDARAASAGISSIAASIPITVDRYSVVLLSDSTVVLAFSILHPEEDTARYALLRKLGEWLEPSLVDELVFYYGESEYYPVRTVSFIRANFQTLRTCMGPVDFQNCAGSSSDFVWTVLTGPMQEWMSEF